MALTQNNYIGFESGGLEEASATSGSPGISTSSRAVKTGVYFLQMNATTDQYDFDPFENTTDAGNKYIGDE